MDDIIIDKPREKRPGLFDFDLHSVKGKVKFFFVFAAIATVLCFVADLCWNNGMEGTGVILWVIGGMCAMAMWIVPLWISMDM